MADASWRTCRGGGLRIHEPPTTPGTIAMLDFENIVLTGPLTPGRQKLLEWYTDTVMGTNPFRNVIITEINKDSSMGRRFEYQDCLLTGYEFPELRADSGELLEETVVIKPQRLEAP
jgi:hypothetical protein